MTIQKKKICSVCRKEVETLYQHPEYKMTSNPLCLDCVLRLTNILFCPKCYSIIHKDDISTTGIYAINGQAMCRECLINSLEGAWEE